MSGYKTFTITWIFVCVISIMVIGCERGQRMLAPVASEVSTRDEPTTDTNVESPVADIFADIELPPEPTIPSDANLLESDNVFHTTDEEIKMVNEEYWTVVITKTANDANLNEDVINFFIEVREYAEKYCGALEGSQPPEISIYFQDRKERSIFIDSLTGGSTTELREMNENWWYINLAVGIVDSKDTYYTLHITANQNPCVYRTQ